MMEAEGSNAANFRAAEPGLLALASGLRPNRAR
jgi:hypothetical protein